MHIRQDPNNVAGQYHNMSTYLSRSETYWLSHGRTVFCPSPLTWIQVSLDRLIGYLFGFLLDAGSPLVLLWAICSNKTLVLNPLFLKQKESSTLLKYKRLQAAVRYMLNLAWSFLISKLIRGVLFYQWTVGFPVYPYIKVGIDIKLISVSVAYNS